MKYLNLLVFVLLISSVSVIFSSVPPFIQSNENHRLVPNGMYHDTQTAKYYHEEIQAIKNIPAHMQTTQIKLCVEFAIELNDKIQNHNAHMFDESFQFDAKKLYCMHNDIKDDQEFEAYNNARKKDIYTETNLVELEQLRIQEEKEQQHQADQIAAEKAGCNCTIS